jgi:hypothetical protein
MHDGGDDDDNSYHDGGDCKETNGRTKNSMKINDCDKFSNLRKL